MKPANTRTKPAQKPVQMCCVRIGYQSLLMPAAQAMKVVEMLQSAVTCKEDYTGGHSTYQVGPQPNVEMSFVRPDQVRAPTSPEEQPGYAPLRLPAPRRP